MRNKMKDKINPVFNEVKIMSPKQVSFSFFIREYRRKYNMSQQEMANICNKYGEFDNVKFTQNDISRYELYKSIPTPRKFKVIMNTLNISEAML